MRELRGALHHGTRATLRAAAGLPGRHPFAIAGAAGALVLILLGVGVYHAQERINVVHRETKTLGRAANVCGDDSLDSPRLSRECADRLRNALLNCHRYPTCRSALLTASHGPASQPHPASVIAGGELNSPAGSEGGGAQNPSHSGQQPGPGAQPGHHGKEHKPKSAPPSPVPVIESPPPFPPSIENNGKGNENGKGGGNGHQPSGVGVELCVLERTCLGVEAGASPKGTLP